MNSTNSFVLSLQSLVGFVLLERYHLLGVLGSGGVAWVYQAKDLQEPERYVAIKVL
ncbi:MAG: hypothetical protein H6727_02380, partial [Myxococcales bacterium]|nr:hypothetical protein [Myxococcales bacterium]